MLSLGLFALLVVVRVVVLLVGVVVVRLVLRLSSLLSRQLSGLLLRLEGLLGGLGRSFRLSCVLSRVLTDTGAGRRGCARVGVHGPEVHAQCRMALVRSGRRDDQDHPRYRGESRQP